MLRGLVRTLYSDQKLFSFLNFIFFHFKLIFAAGVYGGVYASQNYNVSGNLFWAKWCNSVIFLETKHFDVDAVD